MSQDFSKVKVSDKLWVRTMASEGWGQVIWVNRGTSYPVKVLFDGCKVLFSADGCYSDDGPQCLFFGPPEVIAPPPPQRMKKVMVEVRPIQLGERVVLTVGFHDASDKTQFCGPIQQVEVEVEEVEE